MKIDFDLQDLLPLVREVTKQALEEIRRDNLRGQDSIAYTEPEAAALLGVKPHVLRDCRRRGELAGSRVGQKVVYTREALLQFLDRNVTEVY